MKISCTSPLFPDTARVKSGFAALSLSLSLSISLHTARSTQYLRVTYRATRADFEDITARLSISDTVAFDQHLDND